MSLEALCLMNNDNDVRSRLGKLPRRLASLYLEIYQNFFANTYETSQALIKNAFKWLLCVEEPLKSGEYLAAIAQNLSPAPATLKRDELLDLCCNFIILDEGLDTFRFAHPSVKEFLEDLADYTTESSNALAAECCLVYLTSRAQSPPVRRFLVENYDFTKPSIRSSTYSHAFGIYATRFSMSHCSNAGTLRSCGSLKAIFELFVLNDGARGCALNLWLTSILRLKIESKLTLVLTLIVVAGKENQSFAVACAFGFMEIIEKLLETSITAYALVPRLLIAIHMSNFVLARRIMATTPEFVSDPRLSLADSIFDFVTREDMWLNTDRHSSSLIEWLLQREDLDIESSMQGVFCVPGQNSSVLLRMLEYNSSFGLSADVMITAIRECVNYDVIYALAHRVEPTNELLLLALKNATEGLEIPNLLLENSSDFLITCEFLKCMTRVSVPFTESMDLIWRFSRSCGRHNELLLDVIRHRHDLHHSIPWALLSRYDRDDATGLVYLLGTNRKRGQNHGARRLRYSLKVYSGDQEAFYRSIMNWLKSRSMITERTWAWRNTKALDQDELSDLMELIKTVRAIDITPKWLEALVEARHPVFLDILLRNRKDVKITEDIVMGGIRNNKNALWMLNSMLKYTPNMRITERILKACIRAADHEVFSLLLTWDPGAHVSDKLLRTTLAYWNWRKWSETVLRHRRYKIGLAGSGFLSE